MENKLQYVVFSLAALFTALSLTGCARPHREPMLRLVPRAAITERAHDQAWAKLVASDDRRRVLVVKSRGQWEIPGAEIPAELSDTEEGCRRFLDEFAAELGLQIEQPRLAGVFLQHFETRPDATTVFRWYAVRALAAVPSADQELTWMTMSEARGQIPYPMGKRILQQVMDRPDTVWTAEYEVNYAVDPPGGALRVIRDFEPLEDLGP